MVQTLVSDHLGLTFWVVAAKGGFDCRSISTFLSVQFPAKAKYYYFSAEFRLNVFLLIFFGYRLLTFLFWNVFGVWMVILEGDCLQAINTSNATLLSGIPCNIPRVTSIFSVFTCTLAFLEVSSLYHPIENTVAIRIKARYTRQITVKD